MKLPAQLQKQIDCMVCDQPRPADGAKKFHALYVCAACQVKMASRTPTKTP